jgi:AraC family transcriptional regulator
MVRRAADAFEVSTSRSRLGAHASGLVEALEVSGPRGPRPRAESYSPDFQICLPYRGAFVWHVGHDDVVADPNRVLFVTGDEGFRLSRPVDGGYAEIIVSIPAAVLSELLDLPASRLASHELFRQRSRAASPGLQRLGMELLHRDGHGDLGLAAEERLICFVRASLSCLAPPGDVSPSTRRLIGRAKAFLAANFSAPVRLEHVARAAGTTPAYLTTIFRCVEGQPLHQYLVRLRLARALAELPHASDITTLAAELGFASHSHFTAAFRRVFQCTPSAFRASLRRDRQRVAALAQPPIAAVQARA